MRTSFGLLGNSLRGKKKNVYHLSVIIFPKWNSYQTETTFMQCIFQTSLCIQISLSLCRKARKCELMSPIAVFLIYSILFSPQLSPLIRIAVNDICDWGVTFSTSNLLAVCLTLRTMYKWDFFHIFLFQPCCKCIHQIPC